MAVQLIGSNGDKLSWGELKNAAGLTGISFAFTIKLLADIGDGVRIFNQWSNEGSEEAFGTSGTGVNELGFVLQLANPLGLVGRRTASAIGSNGDTLRILMKTTRGSTGDTGFQIWINGIKVPTVTWFGVSWTERFINDASSDLSACLDFSNVLGQDGVYSEFAVWDREVPDQAAIDYGNEISPLDYPDGLLLYTSAATAPFVDDVGGHILTLTGGTVIPGTPYPPSGGGGLPPGTKISGPSIALGLGL